VYVAAGVEHRFHSITEDLTALGFFSTAAPVTHPSAGEPASAARA
jgi:hypothetical protein